MLVEERFWSKIDKKGENDCWLWTAGRDGVGYGQFKPRSYVRVGAHRFAYELTHGEIPSGLFVCHTCDNRLCCNPKHLFLGAAKDNQQDMARKGRGTKGRGYYFHKPSGKWAVQIKRKHYGLFDTEEEAKQEAERRMGA
jgi:hypothetical protein